MAEPLADYLDRLIFSLYGSTQRGIGYIEKNPSLWDVIDYIEDSKTGRPVPIEDSSDHYLLRTFDRVRNELQRRPIPKANGLFGSVNRYGVVDELNECYGEIPWRLKHEERCNTCDRMRDEPSSICSAGHLDIQTNMTSDQPGVVREISRTIPLRKEDEQ